MRHTNAAVVATARTTFHETQRGLVEGVAHRGQVIGAAFAARFLPSRPTVIEPQAAPAAALETVGTAVAAGVPGCCWEREPAASPATVG